MAVSVVPEPTVMVAGFALRVQTGVVTTLWANVAVTLCADVMLTVQLPVPLHAPLQPVKVLPVAGVAVRVTLAPLVKNALHVLPQSMPAGLLVTMPIPVPLLLIVNEKKEPRDCPPRTSRTALPSPHPRPLLPSSKRTTHAQYE